MNGLDKRNELKWKGPWQLWSKRAKGSETRSLFEQSRAGRCQRYLDLKALCCCALTGLITRFTFCLTL